MERKVIETEIWEPSDKKGFLKLVETRKVYDVFKELEENMRASDMLPDEYFLLSNRFDEKSVMPLDASFVVYTRWGSNEGVYIDVDMVVGDHKEHFATGKTLGETEADYDRMCAIAGFIYKSFAGFGRCPDKPLKTYAVCVEESFLRNTQYLDPEELTDDEFEERDNGLDIERAWCGVSLHGFLNIVEAPSREDAIMIVANDFNYDKRTLFAIEIKANA